MKYGNAVGRNRAVEQLQARPRHHEPERRAEQPDHDRLGEQLADDPQPAGAERRADRDLAMADRRAREQQVGDVRAGDQQHQRDGAHHHQDDQLRLIRQHPVADRPHDRAPVAVRRDTRRRAVRRCRSGRSRPGRSSRRASSARTPACCDRRGVIFSPYSASGTHRRWVSGNAKRGGITPMTVCGRPLMLIARPTTPRSPLYRVCQTSWLSITTGSAPGRSSSGPKLRPKRRRLPEQLEQIPGDGGAVVAGRLGRAVRNGQAAPAERGERQERWRSGRADPCSRRTRGRRD